MANRYQTALMDQLDGPARRRTTAQVTTPGLAPSTELSVSSPVGGGIAAPTTPDQVSDVLSQAPGGPKDYQAIFMEALQGKPYGQAGYAELDKALSPQGFQFQKNSAGQYRGRVKAPTGDIWDTALNEGNDNAFLGGGQGTTGAFGILNRGQEGLDAGGWSFGGGGGLSMPALSPPMPLPQSSPDQMIAQGVEQYSQPSKYLEALLAQLGG